MGGIVTWLSDLWNTITNGFNDIIDWFVFFPEMIGDVFDKWFNPNSDQLDGTFDADAKFREKLVFVEQFKSSINNLSHIGKPLQLPVVKVFGYEIDINADFIEPHVPKLRSGLATLFWVLCALSVWRMISGVFNIHANHVSGSIAQDNKFLGGLER